MSDKTKTAEQGSHCLECGPDVYVDEDGCCSTCGRDAMWWAERDCRCADFDDGPCPRCLRQNRVEVQRARAEGVVKGRRQMALVAHDLRDRGAICSTCALHVARMAYSPVAPQTTVDADDAQPLTDAANLREAEKLLRVERRARRDWQEIATRLDDELREVRASATRAIDRPGHCTDENCHDCYNRATELCELRELVWRAVNHGMIRAPGWLDDAHVLLGQFHPGKPKRDERATDPTAKDGE